MAQLTIYLPDDVERKVRADARRAKKSVSAFITELATQKKTKLTDAAWARQVAKLYGSWEGRFPNIEDPPPDEPESF
jgi:predicted CopG family antitoxin